MTCIFLPDRLDALTYVLPAVDALARSGRRLTALVAEPLVELVETVPGIAEAADDPGRLSACDEVVLLSRGPMAGWLAGLPELARLGRDRSPVSWGYAGGMRGWIARRLLSHAVPPPDKDVLRERSATEDFRELLEAMEVPPPMTWAPRLEVSEERRQTARERLERGGIPPGTSPVVALIPGGRLLAQRGERSPKQAVWPWEHFAELARGIRKRAPGARCMLVAGREPLWQAVKIHMETARFLPLIGPDLDPPGIAALLAVSDLAVGADSELLHLAAAVETPTVALFGPTDSKRRAPRGEGHQVLEAPGGDLRKLEVAGVLEAVVGRK